jgi:mono/diheme cytochrome c family protein
MQKRLLLALAACVLIANLFAAIVAPTQADELPADHAAKMAKGLDLFKQHVRSILVQHCVKCHGGEAVESDLDLTDRPLLLKGGLSGPAIIVGNAKESLLYKLVTHGKEPKMPFEANKLSGEQIADLATWIDLGAPYDKPLAGLKSGAASWTERQVPAEARKFWSFERLKQVQPPQVKDTAWPRTPADNFVLAKLEAASLAPNPTVDKRTLIRRAYFDLIGLPPSPEEVTAYLADESPHAYQKVLDRLLASPRYGERWGRHWLDLVRFAESHGFEHDYDRPTAYHYRDFVIQALNEDLPFDTFVKWQLAGDEFAPDNDLALRATGFLAAGVHSTQITKNEVEKHRYDEMDDILSTVSTSMLGLTVGCARCHDHKFDPILQADYYRMLSTFTTTVRTEIELNLGPEAYQHAKAAFDKEHAPLVVAVEKFEKEQLADRFAKWEDAGNAKVDKYKWQIVEATGVVSAGGATFTRQDDGSYLASGKNADFDTYTMTVRTELTGITSVRLEALADPSLVKSGPGRAGNGNFALSDFRITAAPADGNSPPVAVKLMNSRATFEQKGLPIAATIDADEKSAWAVDPQFGKDHAAAFDTEREVGVTGGTLLTFTLQFNNNKGHNIGRVRLALSTAPRGADLKADAIGQTVVAALATPRNGRTPEQSAALLKWYRTTDAEWIKLNKQVTDHSQKAPKPNLVKVLASSEGLPAVRLHSQGADFLNETHFLRRGDPEQKEGVAPAGLLQVLTSPGQESRWLVAPPQGWRTSYRRTALANWMTDSEQGAGHLLARVIVNRLWQHHLGRGIVATPSDFGHRGEAPTHPELLDWLAGELIRNKWQLKPLHKLIMSSAVYQEGSTIDEAKGRVDRENKLLWRRPIQRLEGEVIRDSLLAVGGVLDDRMYGPGTLDAASRRRSVYFTVKRSKLMPMMQVFDWPDGLQGIAERGTTTIAPQALLLMNNPQVRIYARGFARRAAPAADTPLPDAVKAAYLIAIARPPSVDELADSLVFLAEQTSSYHAAGKPNSRELALTDFCQSLMCLNEFAYID